MHFFKRIQIPESTFICTFLKAEDTLQENILLNQVTINNK